MSIINPKFIPRNSSLSPQPIKRENTVNYNSSDIAQNEEDPLYLVIKPLKSTLLQKVPHSLYELRSKIVCLMMQCHRIMKLPIETLHLSVAIFDKVLNTQYQLNQSKIFGDKQIASLGIACLYACQKMQKIRNYGISHWLKHLTYQVLQSVGYPNIVLTTQSLKSNEAYIMQITKFNLFTTTRYDILLAIWVFDPPSEKQFYFAQYLLQVSTMTEIKLANLKSCTHINTACSLSENGQYVQGEQKYCCQYQVSAIDLALAVVSLSIHFFPTSTNINNLIKLVWKQFKEEQNVKQLEQKKRVVKQIANQIFMKVLNIENDPNCRPIFIKYSKQANMAVSTMCFLNPKLQKTYKTIISPQKRPDAPQ